MKTRFPAYVCNVSLNVWKTRFPVKQVKQVKLDHLREFAGESATKISLPGIFPENDGPGLVFAVRDLSLVYRNAKVHLCSVLSGTGALHTWHDNILQNATTKVCENSNDKVSSSFDFMIKSPQTATLHISEMSAWRGTGNRSARKRNPTWISVCCFMCPSRRVQDKVIRQTEAFIRTWPLNIRWIWLVVFEGLESYLPSGISCNTWRSC